ncbi:mitochondrial fission ELM1 family protein [Acetobacter estunensis]|uniref:mitochondrial fission ELM1 family protein n=1 Tax=Acetobacter estunensis TaxID=104097 RepID=UPI001C2D70DB|nr:mitochondrial fission ELM1 family protein [Acetobacter estunensis]MBV1837043.1 mitochondrial fission ELM1 family protein [Acetobacter estunensis]
MTMSPSRVAVVAEDLAGMRSQAFGLAEYLALPSRFHAVQPSGLMRYLPSRLWTAPLRALSETPRLEPSELVFSVAGKGGAVGAALRRQQHRVVQIQNPRMPLNRFDLVIANYHDEISGPNVLLGRTALHGLTPQKLAQAHQEWSGKLRSTFGRPLLAALIGGANGRFRFDPEDASRFAQHLVRAARKVDADLFVTTSRRTGTVQTNVLRKAVEHSGGTLWSAGENNPYRGLIACADWLVVTADSVSMVSEAVAGPAPVYVQTLEGKSRRIGLFLETLRECGRIRYFENDLEHWDVTPLDDTPMLARDMCQRLGLRHLLRDDI